MNAKILETKNLSVSFDGFNAFNKNVFATLFGRPSTAERSTVAGLLETISLVANADIPSVKLSHGEKQRLEIGMLVAQSPDLLFW